MTTILFVDDAAFVRNRCKRILKEKGFEVIEAENGEVAVNKFIKHKPDVVLMDIIMPVMDGIIACEKIIQKDPAAKIIMISSMGQETMIKEALNKGAKDFIRKPFDFDAVLNAIKKVLA